MEMKMNVYKQQARKLERQIIEELKKERAELISAFVDQLEAILTRDEMERLANSPKMQKDLWKKACQDSILVGLMNRYGVIFNRLQIIER
jgi:hypothetical protein